MNIFVSDISPVISARNLDDKRVRHMPKECFEIISIAIYLTTKTQIAPFIIWGLDFRTKPDKFKELFEHRCCKWAAAKRENIWWLWCHAIALMDEYHHRFNEYHYLKDNYLSIIHYIPIANNAPTTFPNASGQLESDIFESYKKCLNIKWFITDQIQPVVWTNRAKPNWARSPDVSFAQLDLFKYESNPFEELPF
jgi:hypothetical protein